MIHLYSQQYQQNMDQHNVHIAILRTEMLFCFKGLPEPLYKHMEISVYIPNTSSPVTKHNTHDINKRKSTALLIS